MIEVVAPGPLTTVQDAGRYGLASIGLGRSGAADLPAYELANRLVGNAPGAAALELTFGGLAIRCVDACLLATAGAPCPTDVSGAGPVRDLGDRRPIAVPAGAVVTFSIPTTGVRTYLAIRGGIDVAPVLGSRSTDLLRSVGPAQLVIGRRLAIGPDPGTDVPTEPALRRASEAAPLRLWPGPRRHWFDDAALATLVSAPFVVEPTSNRIGVRLAGPILSRRVLTELPSEGLVEGAVQVTNEGRPVVMLADHPTTGGYPVIAVVDPADVARVAQCRPGDTVSFRW